MEPTVFLNVKPEMRLWREEVFGPVLASATFRTEEEALAIANATEFGLAGAVITDDAERYLAAMLDTVSCCRLGPGAGAASSKCHGCHDCRTTLAASHGMMLLYSKAIWAAVIDCDWHAFEVELM